MYYYFVFLFCLDFLLSWHSINYIYIYLNTYKKLFLFFWTSSEFPEFSQFSEFSEFLCIYIYICIFLNFLNFLHFLNFLTWFYIFYNI